MSVSSFDHHYGFSPAKTRVGPLHMADGWRVRWSLLLALAVNTALWGAIGFGLYRLIH